MPASGLGALILILIFSYFMAIYICYMRLIRIIWRIGIIRVGSLEPQQGALLGLDTQLWIVCVLGAQAVLTLKFSRHLEYLSTCSKLLCSWSLSCMMP